MIRHFLPLILLSGCAQQSLSTGADPQADIALLTALFADARSIESQLADDFACAGIENAGTEEDASPALIAALRERLGTPVYAASQCRRSDETGQVSAPGATGEGTWLTVGNLSCSSATQCTASVSYYVANLAAGGRDVTAEKHGNGWVIRPSGAMWIS